MLRLFGAPCADAGSGLKKITGEKEPTQPDGKETNKIRPVHTARRNSYRYAENTVKQNTSHKKEDDDGEEKGKEQQLNVMASVMGRKLLQGNTERIDDGGRTL